MQQAQVRDRNSVKKPEQAMEHQVSRKSGGGGTSRPGPHKQAMTAIILGKPADKTSEHKQV